MLLPPGFSQLPQNQYFFLRYLRGFTSDIIWARPFLCEKTCHYQFNFFLNQFSSFDKVVHFVCFQIQWHNVVYNIAYCPFSSIYIYFTIALLMHNQYTVNYTYLRDTILVKKYIIFRCTPGKHPIKVMNTSITPDLSRVPLYIPLSFSSLKL